MLLPRQRLLAFLLLAVSAPAQRDWTYYEQRSQQPRFILIPQEWLEAEKAQFGFALQDPRRLVLLNRLAAACQQSSWEGSCGGNARAESVFADLRETVRHTEPRNEAFASELEFLAETHADAGKWDEALRYHRQAIDLRKRVSGPNSLALAHSHLFLAQTLRRQKDFAAVVTTVSDALATQTKDGLAPDPDRLEFYAEALRSLVRTSSEPLKTQLCQAGESQAEALAPASSPLRVQHYLVFLTHCPAAPRQTLLKKSFDLALSSTSPATVIRIRLLLQVAEAAHTGDNPRAQEILTAARQDLDALRKPNPDLSGDLENAFAGAELSLENYGAAADHFMEAALHYEKVEPQNQPAIAEAWMNAAENYFTSDQGSAGVAAYHKGLALARTHEPYRLASVARLAGEHYLRKRELDEAIEALQVAAAAAETAKSNEDMIQCYRSLARAYRGAGRLEEAQATDRRLLQLSLGSLQGVRSEILWFLFRAGAVWLLAVTFFAVVFLVQRRRALRRLESSGYFSAPPSSTDPLLTPKLHNFQFHGQGFDLFGMRIYHLLLNILTLGLFSFWGKTRVRKYVLSQIEFLGDRFRFHGHGGELLRGFLKGVPILGLFLFAPRLAPVLTGNLTLLISVQIAATLGFFLLWPLARVGAFRYRMSRMSWRSIRFRFTGSTREYFFASALGYLGMLFSLGFSAHSLNNLQRRLLYRGSSLGNLPFQFTGESPHLRWAWFCAWPLTILTAGLFWPWWSALRARYYWAHTTIGEARFQCHVFGGELLRLYLGNLILIAVTLGLATSWVAARTTRFWTSRLSVILPEEPLSITQNPAQSSALGESFADYIGFDFGV